ncbi:class I SAM-dependent RNA methyltransferase [Acetobacter sp. AN02]|uniref:class I SAM-dependent RNA methyltransferase n=1 Tax=Acetobacter sp. AN02 TaxID=2894186 RepID=UPI0024345F72|nr:class I SAM-dependent RNA methyltransferase [Acetobacter sp. AN02]MDG6094844.1 class I SAM-dependent RNA methyltransferase [Acetobacter sp. AN02]
MRRPPARRTRSHGHRPPRRDSASEEAVSGQPPEEFHVTALGQAGDGLARPGNPADGGKAVFIPFALPGETVLARRTGNNRAELTEILTPSPDRITPVCGLYGTCGGCRMQHLAPQHVAAWKRDIVLASLHGAGFTDLPDARITTVPPATRRRADLALRRTETGVLIGLHRRGGLPADLTECHVLHSQIMQLLPALRETCVRLDALGKSGDLLITLTDTGTDLLLSTDRPLTAPDRTRLATLAANNGIARISHRPAGQMTPPETAVQETPPVLAFGDGPPVRLPPGAFLQASRDGENAIRTAILSALPPSPGRKAKITELYAGCGSFTFALSGQARVEAWEGAAPAAEALRHAAGGLRIAVRQQDLNRQPVSGTDLSGTLAVVLDPPHMGAGAQMRLIAQARPETVIYVSCNPQALSGDARLLHAAGYTVSAIDVIDQFLWSAEVEAVIRFSAPRRRSH